MTTNHAMAQGPCWFRMHMVSNGGIGLVCFVETSLISVHSKVGKKAHARLGVGVRGGGGVCAIKAERVCQLVCQVDKCAGWGWGGGGGVTGVR